MNGNTNINSCFNTGTISGSGPAGGIIAKGSGTIVNSYNKGEVKGTSSAGGILGYVTGNINISYCYNENSITTNGYGTGGIIGYIDGDDYSAEIKICYNTGKISGTTRAPAGGIVGNGNKKLTIKGCYCVGDVTSTSEEPAGGIVGYKVKSLENCYYVGTAKSNSEYTTGALVGSGGSTPTINNCYYEENAADSAVGSGSSYSGSATAKTLSYMKSDSFLYDLKNNGGSGIPWQRDSSKNNGFPTLSW